MKILELFEQNPKDDAEEDLGDWEPADVPKDMREIVLLPKSGRWEKNSWDTLTDTMKAAFGPNYMYKPSDYSTLQRGGEGPITIFVGKDTKINYRALYDNGIKVSIQM